MKKRITKHYFSIPEVVADLKEYESKEFKHKEYLTAARPDFCSYSWADTMTALNSGWPEGDQKISAIAGSLSLLVPSESWGIEFDLQGDYWEVGRVVEGLPECAGKLILEETNKMELTIVFDDFINHTNNQKRIVNRGAGALALVDALESSGYAVNIIVAELHSWAGSSLPEMDLFFHVDTKNGFSRDSLAFFLAHPGMLRRVGMCLREFGGAYYNSGPVHDYEVKAGEYYIGPQVGRENDWDSTGSTLKWVQGHLEEIQKRFGGSK